MFRKSAFKIYSEVCTIKQINGYLKRQNKWLCLPVSWSDYHSWFWKKKKKNLAKSPDFKSRGKRHGI